MTLTICLTSLPSNTSSGSHQAAPEEGSRVEHKSQRKQPDLLERHLWQHCDGERADDFIQPEADAGKRVHRRTAQGRRHDLPRFQG